MIILALGLDVKGGFADAMTIKHVNFGGSSYDDEWDDEPYYAPRQPASAPPERPRNLTGSRFVTMHLDAGLLPVRLEFATNWAQGVSPAEVSRELSKAYEGGIVQLLARTVEVRGGWPDRLSHACAMPRKKQLGALLETQTWDQYRSVLRSITSLGSCSVHGRVYEYDEPAVTMVANRLVIQSIGVWPQWSGCSDPYSLEGEILTCAERVRAQRPVLSVRRDYSHYTEDQLEQLHERHRDQLLAERTKL